MRKSKIRKKGYSTRKTVILLFLVLMLTTVGIIGSIVFSNWLSSANDSVSELALQVSSEINNQIDMFIDLPMHINEANQGMIENEIVDINSEIERERYFVEVLKSYRQEAIYSFGYGTEQGEYYGARRNNKGEVEIIENNSNTNGHSFYYSISKDMNGKEFVLDSGSYDPRSRDWYQAAENTHMSVYSPIYKHFPMNDMAITASTPIYSKEGKLLGVLGSHITISRLNDYLKEITSDKHAFAMIVEKKTGTLVANSNDLENFKLLDDGSIQRLMIDEINNSAIIQAYDAYTDTQKGNYKIKTENDRLDITIKEYHKVGLDWLVITTIPESLYMTSIYENLWLTLFITVFALLLSIVIYLMLTNKIFKPIDKLIIVAEKFSEGNLAQRVDFIRNNEIGRLSIAFNKMADTISILVNNLETKVKERTQDLEETNNALKENKEKLNTILDSTAEAIYGIDINGNCTFCNASFLKILGYKDQNEVIGKNLHQLIHHSYRNGTTYPEVECKILQSLSEDKGTHADDEVFWKADGTSIEVEYNSYPQYKDKELIGAVITFLDNSDRKSKVEHIKYLSYHDSLTGLYNRMFLNEQLIKIDTENSLPISIIYGDVNGLKLTNDIFGHTAGDKLLKISADTLKKFCGEKGIVARVGGDEFAILLTNTNEHEADEIITRVKETLSKEQIVAIKCIMSMGYDTKTSMDQDIARIMKNAEDKMYKEKILNRKTIKSNMVSTIIDTLHSKNPREKQHSLTVSEICQIIGQKMNLSETQQKKLKDAGYFHDIGKIVLDEKILNKVGPLTEEERKEMQQHSAIGYRILNLFDDTLDLAEGVLNHHERWDGSGYPKGLKGEEISIIARIIAVAESYDAMTNEMNRIVLNKDEAVEELKKQSGVRLDPEIVKIFLGMLMNDTDL